MNGNEDSVYLMIQKDLLKGDEETQLLLEKKQRSPEFTQRMMIYRLVIEFFEKVNRIKPILNFMISTNTPVLEATNVDLKEFFVEKKGKSTYSYHKKRMIKSALFSYNEQSNSFTPNDIIVQVKRVINEQIADEKISLMPLKDIKEYLAKMISIFSVEIKIFMLLTLFENESFNFSQIERGIGVFTHLIRKSSSQPKAPTSSLLDGHLKDLISEKFVTKQMKSRYKLTKEGEGLARFLNILAGELEDAYMNKQAFYSRSIAELELIENYVKKDLLRICTEGPFAIISYANLFMVLRDEEYYGIIPSEKTHNLIYFAEFQKIPLKNIVENITERIVPFPKDGTWLTAASFLAENNLDEIPIRDNDSIIGFVNKEKIIKCQYQSSHFNQISFNE